MSVLEEIYWIAWREVKHYFRSRLGMASRLIQAATWLVLVGSIFSGTSGLLRSVGFQGSYFQYIAPGVIVMIVIFGSIFGGMTTIWDRRFGYFQKQLATPIARYSLALGKVTAISFISGIQALIILGIALLLGVRVGTGVPGGIAVILVAMLLAIGFASISVIIATVATTSDAFWSVINLIGLPLVFLSSALFPPTLMPGWLSALTRYNPLTYAVDALQALMNPGFHTGVGVTAGVDIVILAVFDAIMLIVSTYLFRREARRLIA
ncbi:MAG: ABC transporter permease [Conexivisphaerales archaeon]|jgi:ABC-2 type transport system permease protein